MAQTEVGKALEAGLSPERPDQARLMMAAAISEASQLLAHRGWMLGGGGHVSVALRREPVRLLITPDGSDKTTLAPDDCLVLEAEQIDAAWPEARLHALLVQHARAGAVIHTQSPASLALSDACASQGGLTLEGYDLLRQIHGVRAGDRCRVPLIEAAPHNTTAARQLVACLTDARQPARCALLVRRCGLVAWGDDLEQARRHAELFETLFATLVARAAMGH